MLRSSSKLITRARSVRNAAKVPFKFSFDFIIDSVERVSASGWAVLVWERSATKMLSTKAVAVDKQTRTLSFGNEQLSSEVTLFKNSPTDKKFQDKVVKLALKANDAEGKTLGKIHLNLADYAEVPSGSRKMSAELNSGATVIMTVQCAFTSMGKGGMKSGTSSSEGTDGSTTDEDDLDMSSPKSVSIVSEESAPGSMKGKLKLGGKMGMGSRKSREMRQSAEWTGDAGEFGAPVVTLQKENTRLRKQAEKAERMMEREETLKKENKALRKEVEDLKMALSREPEFGEMVSQLKETKMALAVLQLEKDELALQLMNGRKC